MVVNELRGEKIDIVPFSEDFTDFVAKALSPAKVSRVAISEDGTQADVIVPDHQLSLAIGREGQNARLAARLTGVRIDIRSETQLAEGVQPRSELDADVEYAEGQWIQNAESGEMEWHAADGTVMSESDWAAQNAAESPDAAEEPEVAVLEASADETETGEGSASDEADAARAQSEAEGQPAGDTDAARGQSEAEGEPAGEAEGEPAGDAAEPAEERAE
jgi:N utilization substance protein A